MTVYDCFPFFNENDLLELRINQHWDYVDKFIITEAGETHTGIKKDFNFDYDRFRPYESKIVYNTINSFNESIASSPHLLDSHSTHDRSRNGQHTDDWVRDHFQGNYPVKVLAEIGASDDDIVYISSLDEILNPKSFQKGIDTFEDKGAYPLKSAGMILRDRNNNPIYSRPSLGFMLDLYVYKFNLFCKPISVAQMTEFSMLKQILPSTMRGTSMGTHDSIENVGWHFSWLDNTGGEKVLTKQKSWAHSRDRLPDQKIKYEHENIDEALQRLFIDYEVRYVPVSEQTHPQYLIDNIDKYSEYVAEERDYE